MDTINPKKVSAVNPDESTVDKSRNITDSLPAVNNTELLKKFINNTVNHAFQPEKSENIAGFIGRVVSYYDSETEFYLPESTHDRSIYQLAPLAVTDVNGEINHAIFYQDLLNLIRLQGGNDLNHDRLFREQYYSWAPPINIDMFINYQNYLWLPQEQESAIVETIIHSDSFEDGTAIGWFLTNLSSAPVSGPNGAFTQFLGRFAGTPTGEQIVHKTFNLNASTGAAKIEFDFLKIDSWDIAPESTPSNTYGQEKLSVYLNDILAFSFVPNVDTVADTFTLPSGLSGTYSIVASVPESQLGFNASYNDRIYSVEINVSGTGASIKLGFGSNTDQNISDESLGIDNIVISQNIETATQASIDDQDYIVISRNSLDQSPWSVNNRWYHIDDLTPEQTDIAKNYRARRPIIEFNENLELYNYGKTRINSVNIVNDTLTDPSVINGTSSYTLDGITLQNGMRILFTNPNITSEFGWEKYTWEGEFNGMGRWDFSSGQTYAANTLTFSNSSNHGIISGGTNFDTVFSIGQRIKITGSSSDGFYFIRSVTSNSLFVDSLFVDDGAQTGEVSISLSPINYLNRIFTVTGVGDSIKLIEAEYGADESQLVINAKGIGEYAKINLNKTFTLKKSKASTDGSLAKIITLEANSQIVRYDSNGDPENTDIQISANRLNTINPTIWTISTLEDEIIFGPSSAANIVIASTDNSQIPPLSAFNSDSNDHLSFNQDGFDRVITENNTKGLIIKASTSDGVDDSISFFKVESGSQDVNDPDNIVAFLSNSNHTIIADMNGRATSFFGAGGEFKVYLGGEDISDNFKLKTSTNNQGLRVSYEGNTYSISGYLDQIKDGDVVMASQGLNAGDEYYWNDTESLWVSAQAKTTRNQAPLFMLYDVSGNKLNDPGSYPNSNFAGNTIFAYVESSSTAQPIDPYLDIRVDYDQYGEILFENSLETVQYTFDSNNSITGYYFYHNYKTNEYGNSWNLAPNPSSQKLISQFELINDTMSFTLEYNPIDLEVYVNGNAVSNYAITGATVTFDSMISKNSIVQFKFKTNDAPKRTSNTSYELPINLTANPFNDEVTTISKSDYLQHFLSIIGNQEGFDGVSSGINNFRDLNIDLGVGTEILQHHNSLAKVMGVGSNDNLNIISAIKYSEREYIRFKNKLINKITSYMTDSNYSNNLNAKQWLYDAITSINIAKNNQFPFTYNTITDSYIPATPSRLGLYPTFTPDKFVDYTLKEPIFVIQGHDGSIMPAFNDFRDDVILEFEQFIYNSIPDSYKSEAKKFYNIMDSVSTPYKDSEYSQEEFNQLLTPIILQWAAQEGVEFELNDTYNETDPYTYNYSNQGLPGYWRGIINLYYGTDRPNTHPWEMFGFSEEPDWWNGRYGPSPYRYNNPFLWEDMRNGYIAGGERQGTYAEYTRSGMPTPVDSEGRVRDPITLGLASASLKNDQIKNWNVGDFAPAETVFRKSSHWPFAVAIIGYLMNPAKFFAYGWDLDNISLAYADGKNPQLIDRFTGKRPGRDIILQGENGYVSNGIQTWLVDYITSNGQSLLEFTTTIRNIDVRVGYKTAGFVNKDTIRLLADNVQTSIPQENVNVFLYQNPSVKEVVYSGVVVSKVSNGWSVSGYDVLNNYFYSMALDTNSKKSTIQVGQITLKRYNNFTQDVISVPYGTTFNTIQQVYDFLVGYGEWLRQQGWVIENFDAGANTSDTWEKVAKDFTLWAQGKWAVGASMSLSPSSMNMKFVTEHGFVENLNQLINGVYSIVDVSGTVIDQTDTFISRNGNEVIIQSDIPIFGIRLVVSEIEHVIILDNVTIFNDLIYKPLLNLYQPRLRLQATRTLDWVGRINAPGYFVKSDTISPNLEKSVSDVQKYFDIEQQVDVPLIQEVARRNIGYQSRSYLDQILISPTTQFQFYQGFIRNKGTISTLSTLLRSGISSGSDDVTFYEEWALKVGDFGNVKNGSNAEFLIDPSSLKTNVQLFEFSFSRLSANLGASDTVAQVENTDNLPDEGIIVIDDEKIRYSAKTQSTLTGLERGLFGTTATTHTQYTAFGLDDNAYDSVITLNPHDPRWIMRPAILTNSIFNTISPVGFRRFNGEYLSPTDNRLAGYVLQSEVFARYKTLYDFTDDLANIIQSGRLEINDQIWVDEIPSDDVNFPNEFQVYTNRLKNSEVVGVPLNYVSQLTNPLGVDDTAIVVSSTANWPESGVVIIDREQIRYDGKTANTLIIAERGFNNTLIGYRDQNGNLINSGTYGTTTLLSVQFSGYGNQVTLELSNNTYATGDTIIFENFFIDYVDYSGLYEVINSYDSNIVIDLAITEDNIVDFDKISILELIESRYKYEQGLFNPSNYTMMQFNLASNLNATDQILTLASTKNLKAPGIIQIGSEIISYQTINGNNLEGLGRGINNTTNVSHSSGATVTRLKNVYTYFDALNQSLSDTVGVTTGKTNDARWYVKANINNNGWNTIRSQNLKVDTEEFKNSVIYDSVENYALAHLQAYDPAKNYFPGQVASEVGYKLDVDPADYSNDIWGVNQVGQVWWDTKNLVYENYETANDYYRSNNWGNLTPFSTVDVYEWVESNVAPTDWAANGNASDYYKQTNGTPYYDENGNIPFITSEKVNANNQTVTVYYFWVKDLSSNPPFPGRNYSVFEIANIIRDPTAEGIVWFAPCSPTGLLVANLNNMALSDSTSLQISYNNQKNINDGHTQWLLMREGDELSSPPEGFWSQMKASLSGFNLLYQPVPDMNVDPINRYGNLKRPRQSWFIDQNKATREFFKSINRLFALDQVVDREGFDVLLSDADAPTPYGTDVSSVRPINPCEFSDPLNYSTNDTGAQSSFVVSNFAERDALVSDGQATIGQQILVEAGTDTGGFWRIYKVVNVNGPSSGWFEETCAESFKYTDFWDYVDYSTPEYDSSATISYTYDKYEDIVMSNFVEGDLIKINDFYADGTDLAVIYKFTDGNLDLIFRQNGTIAFNIDNFLDENYGNNNKKITNSFYPDGVPGRQLAINSIIDILKGTLLYNIEINLIFFTMINQVFSEQLNVDWAFKTTYIVGEGLNQVASQSPVFISNRSDAFIDYVQEAKPYHTKLRDFRINLIIGTENVNTIVTDFDKPVWYDPSIEDYRVLDPNNPADMAIMTDPESDQFWWSQFYDKGTHQVREIETTVYFDRVSCRASYGWDSAGWEEQVWESDIPEYLTAADRIVQSYRELPFNQTDVVQNNVNTSLDLGDLIPGCSFRGVIVNNAKFTDLVQKPIGGWSSIDSGPWSNTPWSPLASGSNIIDISDYNAIYQGNTKTFKFTKTLNGDGTTSTFNIGGALGLDDNVVVYINLVETEDYTITGENITFPAPLAVGDTAKVNVFGDDSFNEASVEDPSDIILDGYLFRQPYIDSDHPEELVINAIGESLSIHVIADGIATDGKVMNRIYFGDTYGPFNIGQDAVADDSVLVFLNGVIQPNDGTVYLINTDRTTLTFRNNIILSIKDRIDIFSFGVGGDSIEAQIHEVLNSDNDTFNIPALVNYPYPLVIVDGDYRTDYTITGEDIIMNTPVLAGSTVDIVVFKSGLYTQFLQKKYDYIGSNTFDLGVVVDRPENTIVTINGVAMAISGDFPDYKIDGQNLTVYNKVKGKADDYNGAAFTINGQSVSGADATALVAAINDLPNMMSYLDKGQVNIVETNGDPITIVDTAGGAASMGMPIGTFNSVLSPLDDILVFIAANDVAHYDSPTYNGVLTYAIPHDIITADQVTATLDGQTITYTVDTSNNTLTLDANPGDGKMLQMVIKFINKITRTGNSSGNYNIGFIPFSSDQLFVLLNGLRLSYIVDYTTDGQILTIPNSLPGDEIQIYFYSSRNANGNGSFIVHYDQDSNRISQNYQATNVFTLGNNINTTDTTLVLNNLTDFNFGRLTLVKNLNVEQIYVREPEVIKRASVASTVTLPNPVSDINQLLVKANDATLIPQIDYGYNPTTRQVSFSSPRTNVEIRTRYMVNNTVYDVIRNYDYSASHSFTTGTTVFNSTGQRAKNRLYRLGFENMTKLAQPLNWKDREIVLTDAIDLPSQGAGQARMSKPGVVWINDERIEFWRRDGNVLKQIVRGTGGTSAGYAETVDSNYRSQTATYNVFTQNGNRINVISPLLDYMEVSDVVSINNTLIEISEVGSDYFKTNTVLDSLMDLTITVFKPRTTTIPAGTTVYNISQNHEYEKGYDGVKSPFGLQFNTVDQMARFINFEYNK